MRKLADHAIRHYEQDHSDIWGFAGEYWQFDALFMLQDGVNGDARMRNSAWMREIDDPVAGDGFTR